MVLFRENQVFSADPGANEYHYTEKLQATLSYGHIFFFDKFTNS